MATDKQLLGNAGEDLVRRLINCPRCKREEKTLRTLPTNFRCADLICDFCGYLAQVKTSTVTDINICPKTIPGAAWGPQRERMESGIYFPLFIVAANAKEKSKAIYYLPADLQTAQMFVGRKPLSATAKRAGWTGYMIDITKATSEPVRLH